MLGERRPVLRNLRPQIVTALFHSAVNQRCLKGLQWEYDILVPWQADTLIAPLAAAFGQQLNQYVESWGSHQVTRLVLKFQFEIRLGERANGLTLLHRVNAEPALRQANQAKIDALLHQLLAGSTTTGFPSGA